MFRALAVAAEAAAAAEFPGCGAISAEHPLVLTSPMFHDDGEMVSLRS